MELWIGALSYTKEVKAWLAASGHYLHNPPPGCLLAIGVREQRPDLLPEVAVACGPLLGLCLLGRPVARKLAQDGSVAEVTRFVLAPGLAHGTASVVLRRAAELAWPRGIERIIAYHDRSRHSGCIYKKAGFVKAGVVKPGTQSWGSRPGRSSSAIAAARTGKRRWLLLRPEQPGVPA